MNRTRWSEIVGTIACMMSAICCELNAENSDFSAMEAVKAAECFIQHNSGYSDGLGVSYELHAEGVFVYSSGSGDEYWVVEFVGYMDGLSTAFWFPDYVFVTKSKKLGITPKVVLCLSRLGVNLFPELIKSRNEDYTSFYDKNGNNE